MQDFTTTWEKAAKGKTLPVQISEEVYQYFIEVLPAIEIGKTRKDLGVYQPSEYFLLGEASDFENGIPVYLAFLQNKDGYFYVGKMGTKSLLERVGGEREDWIAKAQAGNVMRIM